MKIQVTQEHIDRGKRGSCGSCPIALAGKAAFPDYQIEVGLTSMQFHDKLTFEHLFGIYLPEKASKFIDDFDAERRVTPFEFDLDMNEKV